MFVRYLTVKTDHVFVPDDATDWGPIFQDLGITRVNIYSEDRKGCCNMLFCDSREQFQRMLDEYADKLSLMNRHRRAHYEKLGVTYDYEERDQPDYTTAYLHAQLLADLKALED